MQAYQLSLPESAPDWLERLLTEVEASPGDTGSTGYPVRRIAVSRSRVQPRMAGYHPPSTVPNELSPDGLTAVSGG